MGGESPISTCVGLSPIFLGKILRLLNKNKKNSKFTWNFPKIDPPFISTPIQALRPSQTWFGWWSDCSTWDDQTLKDFWFSKSINTYFRYISEDVPKVRKPHKTPKESRHPQRRSWSQEEFWYRFFASIPNLRDHNYRSVWLDYPVPAVHRNDKSSSFFGMFISLQNC